MSCLSRKLKENSAVLAILLVLAAFLSFAEGASAQAYPSRPVTIIVPAAAGGGIDMAARIVAQELQSALDKPFVIENRGGAAGNIATTAAKRAAPDGYTLLMTASGNMVTTPLLAPSLHWDPIRDFAGVATVMKAPHVLIVNNSFPANTLPELIAYAKANPGKLNYASTGVGTQPGLASENLGQVADIKMVPVQYRGIAPALQDVIAGTVNIMINAMQSMIPPIQSKLVKPIALLAPNRLSILPDVPTAREQGYPQIELETWYALYAPAGTPKTVLDLLGSEIKKITEREDFKQRVWKAGTEVFYKSPEETDKFTAEQLIYWSKIINGRGIKVQ